MFGSDHAARAIAAVLAAGRGRRRRDQRSKLGVFADLFQLVEFKVLDIGARGGALDWVTFLAPFGRYYACEPDVTINAKLKAEIEAANPWKSVVIVPEALAPERGPVTLNLTRHAGMSSLLKPNMDVVRTFGLEQEFTVVRQVEVPAVTLAEAAKTYGFEDLCLVKADTQGTELSILESGKDILSQSVQAVFVEVEFREFYEQQPLFGDVQSFLRARGFELISLEGVTLRRNGGGRRVGYSRREIAWGHAMFIRRAPEIDAAGAEALFRQTVQQIGIAMAREQFDLAAERLTNPHFQAELRKRGLAIDLNALEACIRRLYSGWSYRAFRAVWPDVVKHRERYFFR